MRKLSLFLFLIFGFVFATVGGTLGNATLAETPSPVAEIERREVNIDTPETFVNLLNNWANDGDQTAIYYLNCDVDFTEESSNLLTQPTSPLGTYQKPFKGIFYGKGHTITGLNIDTTTFVEALAGNSGYAGLFSVAEDAQIYNLRLAGNLSLKTSSGYFSYLGAVVGLGTNVTLKNVSVDATTLNYNTTFDKNINFGLLAGELQSSNVENVICRTSASSLPLGQWSFTNTRNKEFSFGGIAGKLSNTKVAFGLVQTNINMSKNDEFNGIVNVGGLAGETSGGTTQLINVGINNTTTQLTGENINVGEVVGIIGNPTPNQGRVNNISYIHYRDNTGVDVFGDKGAYIYDSTEGNNCHITFTSILPSREEYYTNLLWDEENVGAWDFQKSWYLSSKLDNQAFLDDLQVGLSNNFNKNVFELRNVRINNGPNVAGNDIGTIDFRFGDKVDLDIAFCTEAYSDGLGNTTNQKIVDYYFMKELHVNSDYATSTYRAGIEMSNSSIRITGDGLENYQITPHLNVSNEIDYFTLTIDELNMYTSGNYNITLTPKTFDVNITSKLFTQDTEVTGEQPGYVYNAIGDVAKKTFWNTQISYNSEYPTQVTTEPQKSIYYFQGWFIKDEYGDKKISNSRTLTIEVGKPYELDGRIYYITGNVDIYAKYNEDSRQIYFSIDNSSLSSGVDRVAIYDGQVVTTLKYQDYLDGATDQDKSIYIRKETKTITLEVYIKKNYTLDADYFAERHTVQGGVTCNYVENSEIDDLKVYKFTFTDLDKSTAQGSDGSVTVLINTKPVDEGTSSLIWIIVGCVAGAILIAGIILLIIFLRRRGGGGNFKGGKAKVSNYKTKKKDFKKMYF